MVPVSGRISPFASLSSTLLPLPAGPSRIRVSPGDTVSEISSRTCLPSNPIDTWSNTTTGCAGSSRAVAGAGWVEVLISSPADAADHEPADHKIDKDDEH